MATVVEEPASMKEALSSKNADDWRAAVNSELSSLEANKT